MTSAERLRAFMRLGRVYRRQELAEASAAVDRDLKALVDGGEVLKLGRGLYCRGKSSPLGVAPPESRELVRAFLRSDDFLLTSFNHFANLGLGLTQRYNHHRVYNHRRGGDVRLRGSLFQFRIVRRYPKVLSKEYLLVDLLNHLRKLPDDTRRVVKSLEARLPEFDRAQLHACVDRYGNFEAKRILRKLLGSKPGESDAGGGAGQESVVRGRAAVRVIDQEDPLADLKFWLGKSPAERLAAVELLREQYYALSGYKSLPRLAHSIRLSDRHD